MDPEFPTTSRLGHVSPHAGAARAAAETRCVVRERETPPPAASRENCPVLGPSCASCVCVWGGGPSSGHRDSPRPHHLLLQRVTVGPPTSLPSLAWGGPPGRPSPPELAHLRQDGEVLILVLLQLEGRGGTAVAQGPEGTRPSALLPNGA